MDPNNVNGFLAVWGVAAPVALQIWNTVYGRRNQVADRKFNADSDRDRKQDDRNWSREELAKADQAAGLRWRRETFINFLSASYDYVYRGEGTQEADVRERHRERFAACFATIMVLDGPFIGPEAEDVWNASVKFANLRGPGPEAQAAGNNLSIARDQFQRKAFQLIQAHANVVLPESSPTSGTPVEATGAA